MTRDWDQVTAGRDLAVTEEGNDVTRYVITMPGRLYQGMRALGAIEDAAIPQGAKAAFEEAAERRRGRGVTYTLVGTRAALSEVQAVLRELVEELDGGLGPARDLGVEAGQLRTAARQPLLPYQG